MWVASPGVILHYLLRGAVERGEELYSPDKEVFEMLKGSMVGGSSLVSTRYYEVGMTKVRSRKSKATVRFCKRVMGYDTDALYLSTMHREMP